MDLTLETDTNDAYISIQGRRQMDRLHIFYLRKGFFSFKQLTVCQPLEGDSY